MCNDENQTTIQITILWLLKEPILGVVKSRDLCQGNKLFTWRRCTW